MNKIIPVVALLLLNPLNWTENWEDLTPGPSARYGHSMVRIDNSLYVYGGTDSTTYLDDLWRYDEATSIWTKLTPANAPAGRKYHAAVSFMGKMYVFGGETQSGGIIDEIWQYTPSSNSWQQLAAGGAQTPQARIHHRATAGPNKIWLTGGTFTSAFNDTWGYDVSAQTWEKGTPFAAARYGHIAGYSNGNIIIHGGSGDTTFTNDTLSYSIADKKWSTVQTSGDAPKDTKFSPHTWENNVLWVSGGTTKDAKGNYPEVNWTYEYNMASKQWTRRKSGKKVTMAAAVTKKTSSGYQVKTVGGYRNSAPVNDFRQYTLGKK